MGSIIGVSHGCEAVCACGSALLAAIGAAVAIVSWTEEWVTHCFKSMVALSLNRKNYDAYLVCSYANDMYVHTYAVMLMYDASVFVCVCV